MPCSPYTYTGREGESEREVAGRGGEIQREKDRGIARGRDLESEREGNGERSGTPIHNAATHKNGQSYHRELQCLGQSQSRLYGAHPDLRVRSSSSLGNSVCRQESCFQTSGPPPLLIIEKEAEWLEPVSHSWLASVFHFRPFPEDSCRASLVVSHIHSYGKSHDLDTLTACEHSRPHLEFIRRHFGFLRFYLITIFPYLGRLRLPLGPRWPPPRLRIPLTPRTHRHFTAPRSNARPKIPTASISPTGACWRRSVRCHRAEGHSPAIAEVRSMERFVRARTGRCGGECRMRIGGLGWLSRVWNGSLGSHTRGTPPFVSSINVDMIM